MKNKFTLLKRTYPIADSDKYCDGYDYILNNTTPEERKSLNIDENKLQKKIYKGERYIYQVAKEEKEFKVMYLCFSNYEIIREKLFRFEDE